MRRWREAPACLTPIDVGPALATAAGDDDQRAPLGDGGETGRAALPQGLASAGTSVIIEWGTWTRAERDALRAEAAACGAAFELIHTDAPVDELWRRIVERDAEGRWGARSIERRELDEWVDRFEPPTSDEFES